MRSFLLSVAIVLAVSSSSCGDASKAKPLSETAVAVFHAEYDAGQFDSMYDASDAAMKSSAPKPEFVTFMEAVHKKLGQYRSSKLASFSVNTKNFSTTTAVLREETTFEHGHGMETFTYVVAGDAVKLQGYDIESNDLVVK